ncbi:MAG: CorA family divalent cation transporter [Candidatus Bathyarchaeia archaeon]
MLRAVLLRQDRLEKIEHISQSQLSSLSEAGNLWLDGSPSPQEKEMLVKKLAVSPDIFEDYKRETKPLMKTSEGYKVLVLQELCYLEELQSFPVLVLLGDKFLVTVHEGSEACDEVYENLEDEMNHYGVYRLDVILHFIMERLAQLSFRVVERLEEKSWDVEDELIGSSELGAVSKTISLRRELVAVNKVNYGLADILLSTLRELPPSLRGSKVNELVEEAHDSLLRQIGTVNELREILVECLEIHNSKATAAIVASSYRSNVEIKDLTMVMLFLTVVATIYLFPNTVATVLGIANLGARLTVAEILVIIAISAILPTLWILRQRWVKRLLSSGFEIPVIPFIPFVGVGKKHTKDKHEKTRKEAQARLR